MKKRSVSEKKKMKFLYDCIYNMCSSFFLLYYFLVTQLHIFLRWTRTVTLVWLCFDGVYWPAELLLYPHLLST